MSEAPSIRPAQRLSALQFGPLRSVALSEIDLPIKNLSSELSDLRILHLTDTHFTPRWCDGYDRLLEAIVSLAVDLIAFTGDWVDDKFDFRPGLPTAQRFARGLRSKFGTYSCLGNHDGDLIAPYLLDAGVNVLVGESKRILGGASSIELIGLPGVAREDLSPTLIDSFGPPAPDGFRLVLMHFPDQVRRLRPLASHLALAGHTHGGQVCLPGGRPIITHDSLPRAMSSGLHCVDDAWLHVSRGIGCSALRLRVFCPPEMTVIRLTPASDVPRGVERT